MGTGTGHSCISKHSITLGKNVAASPSAEMRRTPSWTKGTMNDICQTLELLQSSSHLSVFHYYRCLIYWEEWCLIYKPQKRKILKGTNE